MKPYRLRLVDPMSSLVKYQPKKDLSQKSREQVITELQKLLQGLVLEAYVFGSVATDEMHSSSDIDLILVLSTADPSFTKRGLEFSFLNEVHPALDLLAYTPAEFRSQLNENLGFRGSVKKNMLKIV